MHIPVLGLARGLIFRHAFQVPLCGKPTRAQGALRTLATPLGPQRVRPGGLVAQVGLWD